MATIYFDNSATTAVDPAVLEAMRPYFDQKYGNASSLHSYGREAYAAVEEARELVAVALGCASREIVFTSGGTESDNLAVQGAAFALRGKGNHIITSSIEHHAVLNTCKFLETEGFRVSYVPVDKEGLLDMEAFKSALTNDTILVSVMAANNEVGTIQPISEIGAMAHEKGALFHTDAVQAITKMRIEVAKDNVDLLSLAAHKFHGPKGVGALFMKKGLRLRPMVYGGGHERGLRSSTENVPGIVGLGKALERGMATMKEDVETMTHIRDRLIDGILPAIPNSYLNGHRTRRLCNNVHLRFDLIEGESLVLQLDNAGFACSTGSACSSKSLEPSHVLAALGVRQEQSRGSLRVSLSRMNSMQEADGLIKVLPGIVGKLRQMSPIKSRDD